MGYRCPSASMGNWVTGLCDRSGSFALIMVRKGKAKRWTYQVSFELLVNLKDSYLLEALKDFLKVGRIYTTGTTATFRVTGYTDLIVIMNHFIAFPLVSSKAQSFKLWSEAVHLIGTKQDADPATFAYIMTLYAALGRGASNAVMEAFPDLTPIAVPEHTLTVTDETLDPWWVSGYLTLYCSFGLSVAGGGWGNSMQMKFRHTWSVSFKSIDQALAELMGAYLGVSVLVRSDGLRVDLQSRSLDQALGLVGFLEAYPLQSYKKDHFEVWRAYVVALDDDRSEDLQRRRVPNQSLRRFSYYSSLIE